MAWSVAALVALVPAADAVIAKTPEQRAARVKHAKKAAPAAEAAAKTVPLPRPRPRMIGTQVASAAWEVATGEAPLATAPSGRRCLPPRTLP
jgi:hypothetical protein